jgi:hypothetical protein
MIRRPAGGFRVTRHRIGSTFTDFPVHDTGTGASWA